MEEVQDQLISALVLGLDLVLRQVSARRHPAVHLVREPLDDVGDLEALLPRLDVVLWLLGTFSIFFRMRLG